MRQCGLVSVCGDSSKKSAALLTIKLICVYLENADRWCLRNVHTCLPDYTAKSPNTMTVLDRAVQNEGEVVPLLAWISTSPSGITRESSHESGKVDSPKHRAPLPTGDISGTLLFQYLYRASFITLNNDQQTHNYKVVQI